MDLRRVATQAKFLICGAVGDICSRWKHQRYAKIEGKGKMGMVRRHVFQIFFKNIQFASSQINLSYLGHDTLNNRHTSHAVLAKPNWEPQIYSSSEKVLALPHLT